MNRRRRAALVAAVLMAVGVTTGSAAGVTFSSFSATTTNSSSFSSQRVFPGTRTTSAWAELDAAAGGTGTDQSDATALLDARSAATGNFATTFSTSRYVQQALLGSLPAGVPVSGATANINYSATAAGDTACFYLETRRISTGAVLGTHGSSGTPQGCVTGTTITVFTVSLPEVTTTDIGNDLAVRLYVKNSGSRGIRVDRSTVTASTAVGSYTLYESSTTDASSGTPVTLPWALATAGDASVLTTATWLTGFSSTRYERFTFPSDHVPAGASVASVTLTVVYKSNGASKSTCVWYEVYSGSTVIGSHGSSTTPYSCSATTGAFKTDTVTLTEVNTAARADGLIVRMYGKDTGPSGSQLDRVALGVDYNVN